MKSRDLPPQPSALSQALKRTFGLFRSSTHQDASPPASRHVEFESLEPRLLLSADPLLTAAALAATQEQEQAPQSTANVVADSRPPTVNIAAPDRHDATSPFAGQAIYLDVDHAQQVSNREPVALNGDQQRAACSSTSMRSPPMPTAYR